jgi:hypothetical protein
MSAGEVAGGPAFIYTEAPRYEMGLGVAERFPAGAILQIVSQGEKRALVAGFAASADATVSFDGQRVLFAGKRKTGDTWQIWEVPLAGGAPRKLTAFAEDAITPFYLPSGHIVYARRTRAGYQLETKPIEGGEPVRLTFSPGDHLATDVLRDGRVLFEAPHARLREIYTVYSDGSGVESYRCDHGPDRRGGRQVSSGDIIFEAGGKLERFTSARAMALDFPAAGGQFAGPIAEMSMGQWLVAWRADTAQPFGIYRWQPGQGAPEKVLSADGAQAVEPVLVTPRETPKWHPSGLGNRDGANLLCLNVYTSKERVPANSVATVRAWALNDAGLPVKLGQAPVERDGSFFVTVPSERAIRFELMDAAGKTIAEEKSWFWARRGEQRVCVGCHAGPERAPDNAVPQILNRSTEPARMCAGCHADPPRARGSAVPQNSKASLETGQKAMPGSVK